MRDARSRVLVAVVGEHPPQWVVTTLVALADLVDEAIHVVTWTGLTVEGGSGVTGSWLVRTYHRLDARRFAEPGGPLSPGDLADLVDRDARLVRAAGPPSAFDLGISFVGQLPALELAAGARRGFLYADGGDLTESWLGFREVLRGAPVFQTRVYFVPGYEWDPALEGVPPPESVPAATPGWAVEEHRSRAHRLSPHRTREVHAAKLPTIILRAIRRACEPAAAAVDAHPEAPLAHGPAGCSLPANPSDGPSGLEVARLAPTVVGRRIASWVRDRSTHRQWCVAIARSEVALEQVLAGGRPDGLDVLEPPADRFWADPFPLLVDGAHFVFVEEYVYERGRAHIACFDLSTGAEPHPFPVLERPCHLSYPFVFEWEGERYMLPESAAGGALTLYRSTEFPAAWEPVSEFGELPPVVDATLAQIEDRWWLFTIVQGARSESWDEDLHLFYADSPLGPWRPHRGNPVRIDARGARPAGKLFERGGRLLRPGQSCVRSYGWGIVLNEVLELSPGSFREEVVGTIPPTWAQGLVGTHTLNHCPGLLVLDGVRIRRGRR